MEIRHLRIEVSKISHFQNLIKRSKLLLVCVTSINQLLSKKKKKVLSFLSLLRLHTLMEVVHLTVGSGLWVVRN